MKYIGIEREKERQYEGGKAMKIDRQIEKQTEREFMNEKEDIQLRNKEIQVKSDIKQSMWWLWCCSGSLGYCYVGCQSVVIVVYSKNYCF